MDGTEVHRLTVNVSSQAQSGPLLSLHLWSGKGLETKVVPGAVV